MQLLKYVTITSCIYIIFDEHQSNNLSTRIEMEHQKQLLERRITELLCAIAAKHEAIKYLQTTQQLEKKVTTEEQISKIANEGSAAVSRSNQEAIEFPELQVSSIDMLFSDAVNSENAPGSNDKIYSFLWFYHLLNTDSGSFSMKKKQCDLWEFAWGTSLLFSKILFQWMKDIENIDNLGNLQSIEIGGGLGISTLALCKSSVPSRVLMTDLVADALHVFKQSLMFQIHTKTNTDFGTLNWEKLETVPDKEFDILIGSDILFGNWCVTPVFNTLCKALKKGGICVIADPCRLNDAKLIELLKDATDLVEGVRVFHIPENICKSETELYTVANTKSFVKLHRAKIIVVKMKSDTESPLNEVHNRLVALLTRLSD